MQLGWSGDQIRDVRDIYKGNLFLDETRGEVHIGEVIEMVLDAFEMVMDAGPLAREPCMKMKVSLVDIRLHEDAIHRGPAQVYPAVREGITEAIKTASAALFESARICHRPSLPGLRARLSLCQLLGELGIPFVGKHPSMPLLWMETPGPCRLPPVP